MHGFKCTNQCNIITTWGWRLESLLSVYLRLPLDAKLATRKKQNLHYFHVFFSGPSL